MVLVGPVHPYRGGIAHYTAMLARALAEGNETLVVSFRRQYPGWLYPGKSDRDPSAEPLRTDAEYPLDPFLPWTWLRTARRIGRFEPDLVVMQWWTTFWAPAFWALAGLLRRQGERLTFVVHNVLPHENRAWDRWTARAVLGQATALVVQSQREKERLLAILPDRETVMAPMPPFHDLASRPLERAEARRRLGIGEDERAALFFGVVRPYKGLVHLLDAVAMLRNQGLPVRLMVAGQVWGGRAEYDRQIARLGLGGLVTMDDRYIPNEELPALFGAADVFAAPYLDATQSAALQTAVAYRLPIVATDVVASALDPQDDRCRVVPAGDAAALAEGLHEALAAGRAAPAREPRPSGDDWAQCATAILLTAALR